MTLLVLVQSADCRELGKGENMLGNLVVVALLLGCATAPLTASNGSEASKKRETDTQKKKYDENVRQYNANQQRQAPKPTPPPPPARKH